MRARYLLLGWMLISSVAVPIGSAHHNDTDFVAQFDAPGPVQLYHQYLMLEDELQSYADQFPQRFKFSIIGHSVLGLNIYGVEITSFDSEDPPLGERERMYFDGSIHSNEQLGMEAAVDIIRWLLFDYETDPLAKFAVDNRYTYVVPMVNPDGNMRDSRQNVNSVDLNRNFPWGWGGPGSAAKGPKPLSEPETQAIANWLAKIRPHYSNSFHTGTMMLLHPFGNYQRETNITSPDHDLFTRICQEIQEEMNAANGRPVPCGQVFSTIYPASGTTVDYVYGEFGTNSWTFEVDGEQNLWAHVGDESSLRSRLGETWAAVKHAYINVERYGAVLELLEVKTIVKNDAVTEIEATIKNMGMGAPNNTVLRLLGADGRPGPEISLNPPLQPGETRTVRIPAGVPVAAGAKVDVSLAYNKTFYKGFSEVDAFSLVAVKQGTKIVLQDASGVGEGAKAQEVSTDTPGFEAVVLVVAVAALVGVLLRRRT